MNARLAAVAAIAAIASAMAGCTLQPMRDDVPTKTCDSKSNTRCDIRIVASDKGKHSCGNVRFDIDPERLDVIGRQKVDIRWIIDVRPLAFCAGDGINFPFPVEAIQVFETLMRNGVFVPPGPCVAEVTMPWPANKLPENVLFTYGLKLSSTERTSQTCAIDPWIFNGR